MEWQEADELGDSDDDDSDDDTMMPSSSSLKVVSFVCLKVFHKNLLHSFLFYLSAMHTLCLNIAALLTR